MKRTTPLLLLTMLAWLLPAPSAGQGLQQATDAAWIQWNSFAQSRTANTYSTIIGQPGTSFVPGSNLADPTSATLAIPLPCSLYYLGTLYPAGYEVRASVAGFLSFDGGVSQGCWPYDLRINTPYNRLVMPFWSDLHTTGVAGQGIFYRFDVDPNTYDSTMTIEWSVKTISPPVASGRFQVRLKQVRPNFTTNPMLWRTEISFHYDLNHRLPRAGLYGAVIGFKNLGQGMGLPGSTSPGADNAKLLLLVDTGVVTPDTAAISRLRTFGSNYIPEWYASTSGSPSNCFHYDFPGSDYCVTPVITDVMPDRMPPPPASTFPVVIPPSATLQLSVENVGIDDQFNVPMTIEITYGPTVVLSDTVVVDTLPALTGVPTTVQLATAASLPGTYTLRAITKLPGDRNRLNDTLQLTYYVAALYDGMPTGITSPKLTENPTQPRYVTGDTIPILGEIANSGQKDDDFIVGYTVINSRDSIVAERRDTLKSTTIPPLTTMSYSFGSFTPATPDAYRVAIYCSAMNDEIPENDLLIGMPAWEWMRHGPSPDEPGMRAIPIMVYDPVDLIVFPPPMCLPDSGDTVVGTTPVMALVGNLGGIERLSATAHAVITDASSSTVYNCTRVISPMLAGDVVIQHFDDFTPASAGVYCLRVHVEADSLDPDQSNDTTSWCFTVLDSVGGSTPGLDPGAGEGTIGGSEGDTTSATGGRLSWRPEPLPRESARTHEPGPGPTEAKVMAPDIVSYIGRRIPIRR